MTIKASKIISTAVFLLAGFLGCVAPAEIQKDLVSTGQGSATCAATYYAVAKMTNSSGLFWITPPANTHTGTFTNASGSGSYTSVLTVVRKIDLQPWCGTNSLIFPATNSSYSLTLYVTSRTPPPTNNQPMTLEVLWQ